MNNRDADPAELVSRLMANTTTAGERRAVALLADEGFFESSGFRQRCVRLHGEGVAWRRVREMWVAMTGEDPRRLVLEDASTMASLAQARPPESLEDLQVRIDLDDTSGIVLAAWRDAYAADRREPNPYHHHVDLCLDELRVRFECWNCGRPAVDMTDDDLPVCSPCKENK